MVATDRAASNVPTRESDYVAWLTPRIPGQPWTAPAYDKLNVPMKAPRVFCMASGHDAEQGARACRSRAPATSSSQTVAE